MCVQLQIAHSTLVHANDLEELLEDYVGDVSEHLLHQLGVGGRRLVLVDLVLGPASLGLAIPSSWTMWSLKEKLCVRT